MTSTSVKQKFEEEFGLSPKVFGAPGRVNLIGEHTDYNDGFVLPCAIGFITQVAIAPRPDRKLVLLSEDFPERFEFDLEDLPRHGWEPGVTMFSEWRWCFGNWEGLRAEPVHWFEEVFLSELASVRRRRLKSPVHWLS